MRRVAWLLMAVPVAFAGGCDGGDSTSASGPISEMTTSEKQATQEGADQLGLIDQLFGVSAQGSASLKASAGGGVSGHKRHAFRVGIEKAMAEVGRAQVEQQKTTTNIDETIDLGTVDSNATGTLNVVGTVTTDEGATTSTVDADLDVTFGQGASDTPTRRRGTRST